jgi:hypothetical protein
MKIGYGDRRFSPILHLHGSESLNMGRKNTLMRPHVWNRTMTHRHVGPRVEESRVPSRVCIDVMIATQRPHHLR